jgi:hypothetical protein
MTVNHGVPGSSPGGGAKQIPIRHCGSGFFVPYWGRSLSRCNEVKSGSPGGGGSGRDGSGGYRI